MVCRTFEEFLNCIESKPPASPKEHPILFKGPLVRAILNTKPNLTPIDPTKPTKWQTRRIGKKNYQVGDRLYVREKWTKSSGILYYAATDEIAGVKWKPSIHLPKENSRIFLEVTGLREELLQAIAPADIRAEGIAVYEGDRIVEPDSKANQAIYLDQWIRLWNFINQPLGYGWDVNPVVTVVEFKRSEVQR